MKLAFFSDIHANLPALEAVLAEIDRREPDMVFCLGDLVGYAPWPNEVVESIRRRRIPTIAGNYDEGVGLNSDDCGCAYKTPADEARGVESISFTNSVISDGNRNYLRDLPRHLRISVAAPRSPNATPTEILLVHGSPRRINEYLFEDRPDKSFVRMMQAASADVMLFGHTHKPYHKRLETEDGESRVLHAINIGSVGKPKDGDPRACFAVVEVSPSANTSPVLNVEFVRVDYDVEKSARAIEASPLPNTFADMLRKAY
ncbi:MAG: metallophosphatase family protein [Rhodothermia bacterium]|nr:metallophosphatase family protein [Rhodothermia bacterium]